MRSDVIHISDCGKESLYFCRKRCRDVVYKPHKRKYNKLGIAIKATKANEGKRK